MKPRSKRGRRISDRERMKAKAARVGKLWGIPGVVKNADHLAVCSCHMCRNPRRSKLEKGKNRLTMQERRAFQ